MNLRLLRHATLVLKYGGHTLLVDPMLSAKDAMDPVGNAADTRRIPLVDLPVSEAELMQLLAGVEAVIITHTHRDHWDAKAVELIRKDMPLLCQPEDTAKLHEAGFTDVRPIETHLTWNGITFHRTGGQHGTGEIGKLMAPVSGFVLKASGEPSLYIAGDTVWCAEVVEAIAQHAPDRIVVNAGAAQFLKGDPITMTAQDVMEVGKAARSAQVVVVHMETVNHCGLLRKELRDTLLRAGFGEQVWVPADGAAMDM